MTNVIRCIVILKAIVVVNVSFQDIEFPKWEAAKQNITGQPQLHIFTLANVVQRPIIVYAHPQSSVGLVYARELYRVSFYDFLSLAFCSYSPVVCTFLSCGRRRVVCSRVTPTLNSKVLSCLATTVSVLYRVCMLTTLYELVHLGSRSHFFPLVTFKGSKVCN